MQSDFAKALLDPAHPVPEGIIDPQGRPSKKRFDVYRNNVVSSLSAALATGYPVVQAIVGEEFFLAMARVYAAHNPPPSPLLQMYGANFPQFLKKFKPVAHLAYLPDVAQLEYARRRAYHAPDAEPCDMSVLAELNESGLSAARLFLHPSVQVVESPYPILSIWQKNSGAPQTVLPGAGESVLVVRPNDRVQMYALPPGGASFVEALREFPLGVAAIHAGKTSTDFDLGQALGSLIRAQSLTRIETT